MNNYFNFRDFEIIKKGSQGTILKASDRKGCFFAIKIHKKSFSAHHSVSPAPQPSFSSQSPLLPPSSQPPTLLPLISSSSSSSSISILHSSLFLKRCPIQEKKSLVDLQGIKGIPHFFWGGFDYEIERFVIIEELVGQNLEFYLTKFKKFSLSTTLKIVNQLFKILRSMHERGIIHRDVRPNNLALSLNGKDIILLDFGLAYNLKNKKSEDIKGKSQIKFVGDLNFCGLNAHYFKNDSKLDDLFSLGLLFLYFLQGNLNWINLEKQESSDFSRLAEKILEKKMNFVSKDIIKPYPLLYSYFKHICTVQDDTINYDFLATLFEAWATFEQIDLNSETWDWLVENEKRNSFHNIKENDKSSMESFLVESEEIKVDEMMINYKVPNLKFIGKI